LYPDEYPNTADDFTRLLGVLSPESIPILRGLASTSPERMTVVLGAQSQHGVCLAKVDLAAPHNVKFEGPNRHSRLKGFRPGKAPPGQMAQAYLQSSTPVSKANVARIDPGWIHGRDQDPHQEKLRHQKVVIVGCGSVGSSVAVLLAQAGIGNLTFVDSENLEWANIGRHALGAIHQGKNKARALAESIRQNYPHACVDARDSGWERLRDNEPDLIAAADLIINTTGSWPANAAMNIWQRSQDQPPIILYGWTEAYACAGHAVAVGPQGACLECGMNRFGEPIEPVTIWETADTQRREPGCGAVFQPYGPVELMNTVQLVAQAALDLILDKQKPAAHWIWACRRSMLIDCGGEWNPRWTQGAQELERGGLSLIREWMPRADCPCLH
jgi:molybdopterin/thiamine biosynthesis adenylyltransferase